MLLSSFLLSMILAPPAWLQDLGIKPLDLEELSFHNLYIFIVFINIVSAITSYILLKTPSE